MRSLRRRGPLLAGTLAALTVSPARAQEDFEAALRLLDILMPPGAVVAFNLVECPAGWGEYEPAQGRFIRGIDPLGEQDPAGARQPGSVQQDALQAHRHAVDEGGIPGLFDSTQGTGPQVRAAAPAYEDRAGHLVLDPTNSPGAGRVRTAAETRPDNVALLYCERVGLN